MSSGADELFSSVDAVGRGRIFCSYELMVNEGLLPKDTDWTKGFTTQFVKDLKITAR